MMDLILEAWVSSSIERAKAGWMLGEGNTLAAGGEAEAVVCGLQRHAEHWFRRTPRGNAAPAPAHPGCGQGRVQRHVAEL